MGGVKSEIRQNLFHFFQKNAKIRKAKKNKKNFSILLENAQDAYADKFEDWIEELNEKYGKEKFFNLSVKKITEKNQEFSFSVFLNKNQELIFLAKVVKWKNGTLTISLVDVDKKVSNQIFSDSSLKKEFINSYYNLIIPYVNASKLREQTFIKKFESALKGISANINLSDDPDMLAFSTHSRF